MYFLHKILSEEIRSKPQSGVKPVRMCRPSICIAFCFKIIIPRFGNALYAKNISIGWVFTRIRINWGFSIRSNIWNISWIWSLRSILRANWSKNPSTCLIRKGEKQYPLTPVIFHSLGIPSHFKNWSNLLNTGHIPSGPCRKKLDSWRHHPSGLPIGPNS